VVLFVMASVAVHPAQSSFNPFDVALSFYMNGALGWLVGFGLISLGGGSLLLGMAIAKVCGGRYSRPSLALLGLWATGCIVGGLFPPDPYGAWGRPPSPSGVAHGIAALMAFASFPCAALSLARLSQISGSDHGSVLRRLGVGTAIMTLLLLVSVAPVFQHRPPYALGLVERLTLGSYVAWLLLMNRAVRSISATQKQ
jgi:hypothetical protein